MCGSGGFGTKVGVAEDSGSFGAWSGSGGGSVSAISCNDRIGVKRVSCVDCDGVS